MIAQLLAGGAAMLGVLATAELATTLRPARRRRARNGPALLRALARAGRRLRLGSRQPGAGLEARVAAAGLGEPVGTREVVAAKAGGAAAGLALGALLASSAPGRLGGLLLAGCPAGGFLLPDLWLSRRAGMRARAARRELPALLDLLRVTIDAGVHPARALGVVGARSSGPLGREWRAAARETDLGAPLGEALAGMAGRLPLPEVEALAGALSRSARHGSPLGEVLAAQARDARLAERRRIQEHAARAAPKIQLVVALLLVPSVLLLVAAALAGALVGPGGEVAVT